MKNQHPPPEKTGHPAPGKWENNLFYCGRREFRVSGMDCDRYYSAGSGEHCEPDCALRQHMKNIQARSAPVAAPAPTLSAPAGTKQCSECGKTLPADDFYKHPKAPDGRQSMCKQCQGDYQREYRQSGTSRRAGSPPDASPAGFRRGALAAGQGINFFYDRGGNPQEKWCPRCGEIKPIAEYFKNKSARHGVSSYCKVCETSRSAADYQVKRKTRLPRRTASPPNGVPDGAAINASQVNTGVSSDRSLTLDFTNHPELLTALESLAKHNFRTPAKQLFFMIQKAVEPSAII